MSDYFINGTYSGDDNILYSIPKLYEWASNPSVLDSGASCLYIVKVNNLKHGRTDEPIGSPEFIERMNKASLRDPLIITKDSFIVDGVHRLHRAKKEYVEELLAYVVDSAQFPPSAMVI